MKKPFWFAAILGILLFSGFSVSAAGCTPFLVASGGTGGCSFPINSILTGGASASGAFQATSSQPLYVGALFATTTGAVNKSTFQDFIATNSTTTSATTTSSFSSTASSTNLFTSIAAIGGTLSVSGATTLSSLTSGGLGVTATGLVYKAATTTYSGGLTYTNGNVTCTGCGSSVPDLIQKTIGSTIFYTASTTDTTNLGWYFGNGFVSNASSTINGNFTLPLLTSGGLGVTATGLVYKAATTTYSTGLTYTNGTVTVNTSQNISTLSNLTTNGLVYTSGGIGTLNTSATTTVTPQAPFSYSGTNAAGTANVFTVIGGSSGQLTCAVASASQAGCISAASFSSFNSRTMEVDSSNWISATTTNTYGLNANVQGTTYGYGIGGILLGYASSTNHNTIFGLFSGGQNATTSATVASNTSFGYKALNVNTTGTGNVAIGDSALLLNTTGSSNVAVGNSTLANNISGIQNTAIGSSALNVVTGNNNVGVGWRAGIDVTTGYENIIIGTEANTGGTGHITTGGGNIFLGYNVVGTSTGATRTLNIGNSIFGTLVATSTSTSLPSTFPSVTLGIASSTPNFTFSVSTIGSEFYVTSTGEVVGRDQTNSWTGRISPTHSFVLDSATTTTWTASTTASAYSPYLVMPFAGTLQQARCTPQINGVNGSFIGVNVQVNASNATPSYFVASSTIGKESFTAGNTFSAGQIILANFGTTTTATATSVSCTFDVTETP